MFCSSCGYKLPSVANFCAACGTRQPIVEGVPQPSVAPEVCANGNHTSETGDQFCISCGLSLHTDQPSATTVPTSDSEHPALLAQIEPDEIKDTHEHEIQRHLLEPPYAQFVSLALLATVSASAMALVVADDIARNQVGSVAWLVTLAGVTILLLRKAVQLSNTDQVTVRDWSSNRRKLVKGWIVFSVLFGLMGGLVGYNIGLSGKETNQLIVDLEQMGKLSQSISQARNSAETTVPAQLDMYGNIENDVENYGHVVNRLQSEIEVYDRKYDAEHASTAKTISSISFAAKKAKLLQQQITVAKKIKVLDADAQFDAWNTYMQPLWDEENKLDSIPR